MKFFTLLLCSFLLTQAALAKRRGKVQKHYLTKSIKIGNSTNNVEVFVHYPRNRTEFARKTLDVLKTDIPKVHKYFDYIPQSEVHVVINREEETANGAAGVFPRNTIFLHDFPPVGYESLTAASDWTRILVIHEYVHILTLEMTTGVFDVLRYVFGSFMKWAQFTPRWFAEGMAVWAETQFTGEGRLKHPWIRSYIKKLLFDDKACHDPLCWDRPWHYPSGQLPYWMGGLLFEHMEKKKPGVVSCIAKDYSGNLPLMMNNSFVDCYGKTVRESYREFRQSLMSNKKIPREWCPFSNDYLCEKIFKKFKNVNWFKGYIDNKRLSAFIVMPTYKGNFDFKKEGELLVVYNKESGRFKKHFLDLPIDKIYQIDNVREDYDFTLSLYYREGSGIDSNLAREYRIYDSLKSRIKPLGKRGDLPRCHYLVDYKSKRPKCLTYDNSRWGISEYRYKGKKFNRSKTYNFKPLENVRPMALNDQKLALKLNASATKKGSREIVSLDKLKSVSDKKSLRIKDEEKYSGLQYLSPDYLMLFLFTGGNLTSLGTVTSLSDPLDHHQVNLGLYYNFGLETDDSPYSGNVSYFYASNNWTTGGGYSKFISQSSTTEGRVNIFEARYLQTSHTQWVKFLRSSWNKTLFASENSEVDLFGFRRKLKTLRFISELSNRTNSKSSFYEASSLYLAPMQVENRSEVSYFGFEGKARVGFRPTERTNLSLESTYGKINVNSIEDGILYGGGATSAFTGGFFYPSYLVPFTNISGKEISQSRLTFSWNIFNPYTYSDSIAFYFKRVNLILGTEFIKSDFLINPKALTDSQVIIRDPEVSSYFFGLRTSFDLLYIFPLNIDWVFSKSSNEYYDGSFQILLGSFLTF